jgi:hypothetical protein
MIQELEKTDVNHQQAVFERLIQVNYSGFNTRFSFLRDNFWRLVDGKCDQEYLNSLNDLLEHGWAIVTVTKAFFNYHYSSSTIMTTGVETAVLEKYK